MIYVIRSIMIDIDTKTQYDLLKIGYTEDNNLERRMNAYKLHNPLNKLIYTIPGGTEDNEKEIHRLFRNYLFTSYGREWFLYDQKIIDFFELNKTSNDLNNSLLPYKKVEKTDEVKIYKRIKLVINRWLCLESNTIEKLNKNYSKYEKYIDEFKNEIRKSIRSEDEVLSYLYSKYSINDKIKKELENFVFGKINNSNKIDNFLDEFNKKSIFVDKMRLLCESSLSDQERGIILDQIPIIYKNYYEALGPERLYALGYNKTYVDRAYSDLQFNKEDLKDEIYKIFNVGEKYSKFWIKETLGNLYKSLGYNKTPKANDLEEYFEIKLCKVVDDITGKSDNGFKIIKKKKLK